MVKALPSFYNPENNTMLRGLLQSWGLSDDQIAIQLQNTKAQLFTKLGEGRFLDLLGSNVGVDRDPGLGIEDNDFRELIPVLSFFPKQVRKTLIALLDVFWGEGFTRPNINSGNISTFDFGPEGSTTGIANFINGQKLVKGTGTMFSTEISPGDYIKPSGASGTTYAKVSSVLSDTMLELSLPWDSAVSINTSVVKGPIRTLQYETDGNNNKTIRFKPNAFADLTAVTAAELVAFINEDVEHSQYLTASVYTDPVLGDKLNLRTNTPGLQGSIQILGGDANAVTRLNFSLTLQREVKASVLEINPNEVVVVIPSSVPVLRRSLRGSAHLRQSKTLLFSSNKEVFDFSGLGASSTLDVEIDGSLFTVTFTHSSDFVNSASVTAREVALVINSQLTDLEALYRTKEDFKALGLRTTNGSTDFQVTGGTANAVLGFSTALQENPDLLDPPFLGSFIFDPDNQNFTVTESQSTLTATVSEGTVQSTLSLADASSFPNTPGSFILNYGKSNQEGPINYNSRPNNSTLLIDASYTFQNTHTSGSTINFVSNQPSIPRVTGEDYPVFITGTEEAREAAQDLIRNLLAAGVIIRFVINFPEFLFECVCRDCGPPEDANYQGSLTGQGPLSF